MVGGPNYRRSTFNRATRSRRQAGSAFKPFVYAAALADGFSPVSVLSNLDRVTAPRDPEWHPSSVTTSRRLRIRCTLRAALAESNNAAAAPLQQRSAAAAVLRLASDAGLKRSARRAVAGARQRPRLAARSRRGLYDVSGGGEVVRPRGHRQRPRRGRLGGSAPSDRARACPHAGRGVPDGHDAAEVVERAPPQGPALGVAGPIGGKTGTTDDYHDAWFVGFSTSVVAGVWVGFDQPAPIGPEAYGARVALPIWADFMKRAAATMPARDFPVPPDVTGHELCSVSHLKPLDDCPVYTEYFKEGDDVPSRLCPVHRGSLKQVAARAVQGILRGIGRSISGILGRD